MARVAAALTLLRRAVAEHAHAALASSFGTEDMVLIAHRATGSFILIDEATNDTVAAGMIRS